MWRIWKEKEKRTKKILTFWSGDLNPDWVPCDRIEPCYHIRKTQISKYSWKKASCLTLFSQFSPIIVYEFVIRLRRKPLCIKRGGFLKYLNHSILSDKATLNILRTSIFWLHIGKCAILFKNNFSVVFLNLIFDIYTSTF